jgi:hypothetical protein
MGRSLKTLISARPPLGGNTFAASARFLGTLNV